MNYRADLKAFRGLVRFLASDCCNGRPELCGDLARLLPAIPDENEARVMTPAFNVLFLCTHNSARSIMAEALLEKIGRERFHAYSAGSEPAAAPMPEVIEAPAGAGARRRELRCKSWNEFTGPDAPRMDFVITLCDTLHGQTCPELATSSFITAAWPLPDPAKFTGAPTERATLLNELYAPDPAADRDFHQSALRALDKMAMKARLDEIGGQRATARVRRTRRCVSASMGWGGSAAWRCAPPSVASRGRQTTHARTIVSRSCMSTN